MRLTIEYFLQGFSPCRIRMLQFKRLITIKTFIIHLWMLVFDITSSDFGESTFHGSKQINLHTKKRQ